MMQAPGEHQDQACPSVFQEVHYRLNELYLTLTLRLTFIKKPDISRKKHMDKLLKTRTLASQQMKHLQVNK